MRIETDFIGAKEISDHALYGIQSIRAKENFPFEFRFDEHWYQAIGTTKQACYLTYKSFKHSVIQKYGSKKFSFEFFSDELIEHLILSSVEVEQGKYYEHFIVSAIQGGAGTSINMNVNEIISNSSLQRMGEKLGAYHIINPVEHANVYQSTNDVIPT